jgi:hypothetical protein
MERLRNAAAYAFCALIVLALFASMSEADESFTAVVLVCAASVPPQACDESRALDAISTRVDNEFGCLRGFQETMARGGLREGLGEGLYLKTECVRERRG